jgi:hypothetical protein
MNHCYKIELKGVETGQGNASFGQAGESGCEQDALTAR